MSEPLELDFVVTLYPAPVLRQPAQPVAAFDGNLKRIVEAMFRRMYLSKGVGLAAPQVGLAQRILVLDPSGEQQDSSQALVLVNPTLVSRSGAEELYEEGCLSFPGIYAEVRRPERCRVRAFDLSGQETEVEYTGFVSRIIQHEYDHLEGVLLVDRMSPADRQKNRGALEDLVARFKEKQARSAVRSR
jgi:peptide deformylase